MILPLAQLLGRPFGAVVLPGCDEVRLRSVARAAGPLDGGRSASCWACPRARRWRPPSATPGSHALQHAAAGSALARQRRRRRTPDAQPLGAGAACCRYGDGQAIDPRVQRALQSRCRRRARCRRQPLPDVTRLSASAYEDLRHCPYRFFALRQLRPAGGRRAGSRTRQARLRHLAARRAAGIFHEALQTTPHADAATRRQR